MNFTDIPLYDTENTQSIGGNVFDAPKPDAVLDFSCNNNILQTPKNILKQLKKCRFSAHPDLKYGNACDNLAKNHGTDAENIIIDTNAYSLLGLILKSLKIRGATIVMPCETEYKHICRINSCDIIPYILQERKNFKLDCDDFIEKITSKSDAVIISNPCSVTGRVVSKSDMHLILDYCQSRGIYVIVDETYMDFVPVSQSSAGFVTDYHNLVIVRSLTEYYNLSGLNAAYGIASPEVVEIVKSNQLPWQVDVLGCTLCENAYHSEKFDIKTKKWVFSEKARFLKKLREIRTVKTIHSDCHYVLMSLDEVSASSVYNRLLKSNILIRDASDFTGLDGSYIRVAIRDEKTNDKLIDELVRCLI